MCTTSDSFYQCGEDKNMGSFSDLDPIYQDQLLVLDTFHEVLDNQEISLGVNCTSRRLSEIFSSLGRVIVIMEFLAPPMALTDKRPTTGHLSLSVVMVLFKMALMDSLIDFSFSLICSSDRKLHLHTIICSALSKKRANFF
ncbi:hypothetical protein JG687_00007822 [Phytophthora cactorum]|uniref:Uncharacterized protein n=1 Tax=Phytophthora cactorum TaxID=29920 RepID=A0A8T1UED3_9STRA|nr:hypothetical protein JG687_00007822 [Phytophthora cactorum]